jgi:hypothetical protein
VWERPEERQGRQRKSVGRGGGEHRFQKERAETQVTPTSSFSLFLLPLSLLLPPPPPSSIRSF